MLLRALLAVACALAAGEPAATATTAAVRDLYAEFPFPPLDSPFPERHGGARVRDDFAFLGPSHTAEIDYFVFGGRLGGWRPEHRVLLAGGGTGAATLALVREVRAAGGEVVHLDLSAASLAQARELYARSGVEGVRLVEGSMLDPALARLGPFDYVDASGTVHHTADPPAALRNLAGLLRPDSGGIGLMVYGALGRTAIYHLQQAMKPFREAGLPLPAQLDVLWDALGQLPPTNWMHHNPTEGAGMARSAALDAVFVDAFLHPQDVAYTVASLHELVRGAGLRRTGWLYPAWYDPASYLREGPLLAAARALSEEQRAQVAESLGGFVSMHELFVVRASNPVAPPQTVGLDTVLVPRVSAGLRARIAAQLRSPLTQLPLKVDIDGNLFELPLADGQVTAALIDLLDGQRTLREVHALLAPPAPAAALLECAQALFSSFHGVGWMQQRSPASPGIWPASEWRVVPLPGSS